jgi:hypothetical protein
VRKLGGRLIAAAALSLALAPSAIAAPHQPTGEFSQFGYCPLDRKTITDCIFSVSTKGAIVVGNKTVPIKNPVTLQGGAEGSGENVQFYGADGAETLSRSPQKVPGGLTGIEPLPWWPKSFQEWFRQQINEGATEVKSTLVLATPPTSIKLSTENLLNQNETALGLPVKIKLDNPILGSSCYIGSSSNPVEIEFTTGRSGTLKGSPGVVNFNNQYTHVTMDNARIVNGTFAAPKVEGCGGIFSSFIDPLVNSVLDLPAASGRSTAIMGGKFQSGAAKAIKGSE